MTENFYDSLAPYYKMLYPDWDASVARQADALDSVIREYFGKGTKTLVDVACGIGTQSIGLAKYGYRVSASDISSGEIDQAKREASRHQVDIRFLVGDMRQAWDVHQRQFDILIACDNAVPHLLTDEEILQAFQQFHKTIKDGGGCIISVRDYAQLERTQHEKKFYPRRVQETETGQIVLFDIWDFYDADHYEITTYLVDDDTAHVKTRAIRGGKYYCVEIPTLEMLLLKAGFQDVMVLRERFFQPLLVARKGNR